MPTEQLVLDGESAITLAANARMSGARCWLVVTDEQYDRDGSSILFDHLRSQHPNATQTGERR